MQKIEIVQVLWSRQVATENNKPMYIPFYAISEVIALIGNTRAKNN